jgi:hypothetical protein
LEVALSTPGSRRLRASRGGSSRAPPWTSRDRLRGGPPGSRSVWGMRKLTAQQARLFAFVQREHLAGVDSDARLQQLRDATLPPESVPRMGIQHSADRTSSGERYSFAPDPIIRRVIGGATASWPLQRRGRSAPTSPRSLKSSGGGRQSTRSQLVQLDDAETDGRRAGNRDSARSGRLGPSRAVVLGQVATGAPLWRVERAGGEGLAAVPE